MIRSEVHKVPESSTNKRVLSHPTNCFFKFLECWISSNLTSWIKYTIYTFSFRWKCIVFISISSRVTSWPLLNSATLLRFGYLPSVQLFAQHLPRHGVEKHIIPSHPDDSRADLLSFEMIFVVGRTKWWQILILYPDVVVSIIPKIFFENKWKGSKLTPIRGDHFWQSCPCHHPGPQAIGGAISLKHCVAGPRAAWFWEVELPKRWRCWNVWKGPTYTYICI